MKPCDHDSYPIYKAIIGPLRDRARELGYALAVHGTLKRDIDLVAIPWAEEAVPSPDLAEQLRQVIERVHGCAWDRDRQYISSIRYHDDGHPGAKPHGRVGWTFHLTNAPGYTGHGPYVDLAVMPRFADVDARPSIRFRDCATYEQQEQAHPLTPMEKGP